jgi:Ser/Thr protein kinase RdoA (MazF antagonist)
LLLNISIKKRTFNKNIFHQGIREYEKIYKLTVEEKKIIPLFMLFHCCVHFWWFYAEMKKDSLKRRKYLRETIKKRKIIEEFMREEAKEILKK